MKILIAILLILSVAMYFYFYSSPLQKIDSFRIYYGDVDEDILSKMKAYDMVVVEALFFDAAMVEELHDAGVTVIGYLSVSEVGSWDNELIDRLTAGDYLMASGLQMTNGKNQLGDLTETHFQEALIETLEERIMRLNMDGVFFDTLDSINLLEHETDRIQQALGYYEVISSIKDIWPKSILIQNRGFEYLPLLDRNMIDAILWENFSGNRVGETTYKARINILKEVYLTKNIRTMSLSYTDDVVSRKAAARRQWLFSYLDGQEGLTLWK